MALHHLRAVLRVADVGRPTITVILPQATEEQIGLIDQPLDGPPPVLYLLHGLSDDHTAWLRYTSIERYAVARGLAVVMPAVDRSFYANEAHGHRYWDLRSPKSCPASSASSSASPRAARTPSSPASPWAATAPSSYAFTHPDRYAAVGQPLRRRQDPAELDERPAPAGDRGPSLRRRRSPPTDDVLALLDAADPASLPQLYVGCGHRGGALSVAAEPSRSSTPPRPAGIGRHRPTSAPAIHEWYSCGTRRSRTSSPGSRCDARGSLGSAR